jgi:hypothetical protein
MRFVDVEDVDLKKPIIIAAMQDMGNVASIAVDFMNKNLRTRPFRCVYPPSPDYVVDKGGFIDYQQQVWEYRYGRDVIIFGGGVGQPQTGKELYELCQDVIDIARKYSVQLIYTLGAFHTDRKVGRDPKALVTATSPELIEQVRKLGIDTTPGSSLITGFNGLILGFAKMNNIQAIGLYGEIEEPGIPQYRAAKSVLQTLERLTYQKFGDYKELDAMAEAIDNEVERMKKPKSGPSW